MLARVIVDDLATKAADGKSPASNIGNQLTLLVKREVTDANLTFDSNSNLGLRLLRAFFLVSGPSIRRWVQNTRRSILQALSSSRTTPFVPDLYPARPSF